MLALTLLAAFAPHQGGSLTPPPNAAAPPTLRPLAVQCVFGSTYCQSNVNSTGLIAVTVAEGSVATADNLLFLRGTDVPMNSFGYFLCSKTPAFTANPGGSAGNLCLGGEIGRFRRSGEVQASGTATQVELQVDLTNFPGVTSTTAVQPGDTWFFQYWFRDGNSTGPTSNFASGVTMSYL